MKYFLKCFELSERVSAVVSAGPCLLSNATIIALKGSSPSTQRVTFYPRFDLLEESTDSIFSVQTWSVGSPDLMVPSHDSFSVKLTSRKVPVSKLITCIHQFLLFLLPCWKVKCQQKFVLQIHSTLEPFFTNIFQMCIILLGIHYPQSPPFQKICFRYYAFTGNNASKLPPFYFSFFDFISCCLSLLKEGRIYFYSKNECSSQWNKYAIKKIPSTSCSNPLYIEAYSGSYICS